MKKLLILVFMAILCPLNNGDIGWLASSFPAFSEENSVILINNSVHTSCAEEDNINMPLYGMLSRFVIEATIQNMK